MTPDSNFRTLVMQVISGEISPDDRLRFYEMIEDKGHEEEFKTILLELYKNQENKNQSEGDAAWESMIQAILSYKTLILETPVHKIPVYKKIWFRTASAAAVILGLLGTYFILKSKAKPQTETAKTENKPADIAPASNKAVLILSTGQKIVLDSTKIGQLAKIGNTTISKTDSGKLLYASNGSKAANENSFNTLTTPRGGIYELVLPDGTHAWLNAVSRIDYPTRFTGKKREVKISGEVYFEVAHDAAHPFVVSVANTQVEVLGTHFNIKSYDSNKIRTTLLEGSIKISTHNQNKIIKPGEQAVTGTSNNSIELRRDADPDDVMAWRNGEMALSSGSVKEVMNEISRWYDMDIEYAGAVPNKQFYGSVRRDVPLSTVLHALEAYGVQTKVDGKKIIVQ